MPLEPTRLAIDPAFAIGAIDPRVFGSFVEHMGRCVYEGIYEPTSPLSDPKGVRQDVIAAAQEMGVTTVRYPGGNFVSNYRWRDGIGPKRDRPIRKDLAWRSLESNQFGTDEFLRLCERIGWIPMMTCNLGTGGPREALEWFQYINDAAGQTTLAKEREANGRAEPYRAKLWCLGNEMDGPWQLGHKPAEIYAADAKATAKLMRDGDDDVETVVCGSSGPLMKTFADWDGRVLDIMENDADHIALHNYLENRADDCQCYLFAATTIRRQIAAIDAVCVASAAKRKSAKRAYLCFDEWNVWYKAGGDHEEGAGHWTHAPHLAEEVYNLEDAIVVSDVLHTFLERADVVKIANMAQLVNVIAPMLTTREGLLKQTTFFPFRMFAQRSRGTSLRVAVRGPEHEFERDGMTQRAPFVAASAVHGEGRLHLLLTNRSQHEAAPLQIRLNGFDVGAIDGEILTGSHHKDCNTWESPATIVPTTFDGATIEGDVLRATLPPMSFVALSIETSTERLTSSEA